MTDNFASYEISNKLWQMKAPIPFTALYTKCEGALIITAFLTVNNGYIPAFLYEDIFRWLRDKHNLKSFIAPNSNKYFFDCYDGNQDKWICSYGSLDYPEYDDYREAQEACINWLLDTIN